MGKPTRTFSADVKHKSTGTAGPDQIEYDLDNLFAALDPSATFRDGAVGGIGKENVRPGSLDETLLAQVTIDQSVSPADSGKYTALLSGIANVIKALKGTDDWKSQAATSLAYLLANKSDVGHTHGVNPDGHTHTEFPALDMFNIARVNVTTLTVARDANKRIIQMDYTVNSGETGSIKYHRDVLGRIDCSRYSNSLGTQIQIELIRGGDGLISSVYRSAFNATLQSGTNWPIT